VRGFCPPLLRRVHSFLSPRSLVSLVSRGFSRLIRFNRFPRMKLQKPHRRNDGGKDVERGEAEALPRGEAGGDFPRHGARLGLCGRHGVAAGAVNGIVANDGLIA